MVRSHAALSLLLCLFLGHGVAAGEFVGRVVSIQDGDTLTLVNALATYRSALKRATAVAAAMLCSLKQTKAPPKRGS